MNINEYELINIQNIMKFKKFIIKDSFNTDKVVTYNKFLIDKTSHYSSMRPTHMKQILDIIETIDEKKTILDCNSNIGANIINIAKYFKESKCTAVELDKNIYKLLVKNIKAYKANITPILGDCLDYIKEVKYDIIIFDPPWPNADKYKKYDKVPDLTLSGVPIHEIINDVLVNRKAKHVLINIPLKYDLKMLISCLVTTKIKVYDIMNKHHKPPSVAYNYLVISI
jgi:16S rRNA G966 N2-methylase RsmD